MAISEISSKSHFKGTRSLRAEAKNVSSFAGCPVFVVFDIVMFQSSEYHRSRKIAVDEQRASGSTPVDLARLSLQEEQED